MGKSNSGERQELESLFSIFWEAYPKKVAKIDAHKAWMRLKPSRPEFTSIMIGLTRYFATNEWKDRQFIPYPATFLNGKRWEDELSVGGNMVSTPAPRYCATCGHTGSWHLNETKHGRNPGHEFVLASDTQDIAQPSGAIATGRI